MKPKDAKKELQKRIKEFGTSMARLTPAQGIRLMLDFYKDVRADDCSEDEDGDMLLFQWGTYAFDTPPYFNLDITRQFIALDEDDEDEDGCMSQLSFTFHFPLTAEFKKLKEGNKWCESPDKLKYFEKFIADNAAYLAVGTGAPTKVALEFGEV